MMMLSCQKTSSRTDMPTSFLVSFFNLHPAYKNALSFVCVCSVDDFSRVKISRVDKKEDDTDYINATHIDVRAYVIHM